ncbi:MAG TPA: nucleoside hydrolase [Kineosporiaceae bacterium]|nr:nucleoside hydrolase [Kineosporiaceae bacterium]
MAGTGNPLVPMILDVDTGVDDALALLLAVSHPQVELLGVTCVDGNAPLTDVVRNTLSVLSTAGAADVPVASGAERPLIADPSYAPHVHGQDGMADLDLPAPTTRALEIHAVELIRKIVTQASEPVTLVALAPLTNLALLIRLYPRAAEKIGRIVLMGGAIESGNATSTAEFNIWHDPEAAAIVFSSGLPITMYGLDVFYRPRVSPAEIEELAGSSAAPARLAGRLLGHQAKNYVPVLGDAGAVVAAIAPASLRTRQYPVHVELGGATTRGMTVVDRREWDGDRKHLTHRQGSMIDVAVELTGQDYVDVFMNTLVPERREAAPRT